MAAVVAATGWAPYDAAKIDNLGYGQYPNVVTNVIMERLAAANGPTGRQDPAPLRRTGSRVCGLRAVRRVARRESSALLLRRLLRGLAQAGDLYPRRLSRRQGEHFLHRRENAGPPGGLLRQGFPPTPTIELIKGKVAQGRGGQRQPRTCSSRWKT